jgi:hypothetical protein
MNTPSQTFCPLPEDYCDHTQPRILAFLHAVRPERGVADAGTEDEYHRGRNNIEKLAWSSQGCESPAILLNQTQCADVCHFLGHSEPLDEASWWTEPEDAPSHLVGLRFVLEAVEESLRRYYEPAEGPGPGSEATASGSDHSPRDRADRGGGSANWQSRGNEGLALSAGVA